MQRPESRQEGNTARIAAGGLLAATSLPLLRGAARFAGARFRPTLARAVRPLNKEWAKSIGSHGKRVVDYIEGSQQMLNRGVTGKLAGLAIQRNTLNQPAKGLLHTAKFRAGPSSAFSHWTKEVSEKIRPGASADLHATQSRSALAQMNSLMKKGGNESEALKEVATSGAHADLMRRMITSKSKNAKDYSDVTAVIAGAPVAAGAGIYATRNKKKELSDPDPLIRLEAQLDGLIDFSMLGMLAIGSGVHVAQNAMFKAAASTKYGKRVLASLFQSGVRHAKSGKQVRPGILRATDAIAGPEYSHIYKQGLKSTRIQRLAASASSKLGLGKDVTDATDVMTGRRSKGFEKVLNWAPKAPVTNSKWAGATGGAVAAAGAAFVEPLVPAVNLARTIIAETSMGERILKSRFLKGIGGDKPSRVRQVIEDYVASPTLGKVQAMGYGISRRAIG